MDAIWNEIDKKYNYAPDKAAFLQKILEELQKLNEEYDIYDSPEYQTKLKELKGNSEIVGQMRRKKGLMPSVTTLASLENKHKGITGSYSDYGLIRARKLAAAAAPQTQAERDRLTAEAALEEQRRLEAEAQAAALLQQQQQAAAAQAAAAQAAAAQAAAAQAAAAQAAAAQATPADILSQITTPIKAIDDNSKLRLNEIAKLQLPADTGIAGLYPLWMKDNKVYVLVHQRNLRMRRGRGEIGGIGGSVDPTETFRVAAVREAKEEAQIMDVTTDNIIPFYLSPPPNGVGKHRLMFYRIFSGPDAPIVNGPDEAHSFEIESNPVIFGALGLTTINATPDPSNGHRWIDLHELTRKIISAVNPAFNNGTFTESIAFLASMYPETDARLAQLSRDAANNPIIYQYSARNTPDANIEAKINALYGKQGWTAYPENQDNTFFYIAKADRTPVSIVRISDSLKELDYDFTDPDFRRLGLYEKLLVHRLAYLKRERPTVTYVLYTENDGLKPLHQRLGMILADENKVTVPGNTRGPYWKFETPGGAPVAHQPFTDYFVRLDMLASEFGSGIKIANDGNNAVILTAGHNTVSMDTAGSDPKSVRDGGIIRTVRPLGFTSNQQVRDGAILVEEGHAMPDVKKDIHILVNPEDLPDGTKLKMRGAASGDHGASIQNTSDAFNDRIKSMIQGCADNRTKNCYGYALSDAVIDNYNTNNVIDQSILDEFKKQYIKLEIHVTIDGTRIIFGDSGGPFGVVFSGGYAIVGLVGQGLVGPNQPIINVGQFVDDFQDMGIDVSYVYYDVLDGQIKPGRPASKPYNGLEQSKEERRLIRAAPITDGSDYETVDREPTTYNYLKSLVLPLNTAYDALNRLGSTITTADQANQRLGHISTFIGTNLPDLMTRDIYNGQTFGQIFESIRTSIHTVYTSPKTFEEGIRDYEPFIKLCTKIEKYCDAQNATLTLSVTEKRKYFIIKNKLSTIMGPIIEKLKKLTYAKCCEVINSTPGAPFPSILHGFVAKILHLITSIHPTNSTQTIDWATNINNLQLIWSLLNNQTDTQAVKEIAQTVKDTFSNKAVDEAKIDNIDSRSYVSAYQFSFMLYLLDTILKAEPGLKLSHINHITCGNDPNTIINFDGNADHGNPTIPAATQVLIDRILNPAAAPVAVPQSTVTAAPVPTPVPVTATAAAPADDAPPAHDPMIDFNMALLGASLEFLEEDASTPKKTMTKEDIISAIDMLVGAINDHSPFSDPIKNKNISGTTLIKVLETIKSFLTNIETYESTDYLSSVAQVKGFLIALLSEFTSKPEGEDGTYDILKDTFSYLKTQIERIIDEQPRKPDGSIMTPFEIFIKNLMKIDKELTVEAPDGTRIAKTTIKSDEINSTLISFIRILRDTTQPGQPGQPDLSLLVLTLGTPPRTITVEMALVDIYKFVQNRLFSDDKSSNEYIRQYQIVINRLYLLKRKFSPKISMSLGTQQVYKILNSIFTHLNIIITTNGQSRVETRPAESVDPSITAANKAIDAFKAIYAQGSETDEKKKAIVTAYNELYTYWKTTKSPIVYGALPQFYANIEKLYELIPKQLSNRFTIGPHRGGVPKPIKPTLAGGRRTRKHKGIRRRKTIRRRV